MESPDIINKHTLLVESENLGPQGENFIGEGKNNKHKRSPQTPSAKQMNVTRRRFDDPESTIPRSLNFNAQNAELMHSKYENWKLGQSLRKTEETLKFIELERKLEREYEGKE